MRIASIAVVIVLASSHAEASPSCMTLAEARAKFGGAHLWWHGPNKCWDATPSRRHLAKRIKDKEKDKDKEEKQAGRIAADEPRAQPEQSGQPKSSQEAKPQRWSHDNRWREAMSKMLPEDAVPLRESAQPPARASAGVDAGHAPAPAPRPDWRERWVELAQPAAPAPRTPGKMVPADLAAEVNDAPVVTPGRVMLALLAVVLVLGFVELLFRSTIPDWRQRRDRQP